MCQQCQTGYGLRGPSQTTCLSSGEWAQPFPTCTGLRINEHSKWEQSNKNLFYLTEVQCDNPGAPMNGYAQGSAPYRAGDVIQFNCNPEFMMQGQPIIACQDNGRWSGVLPKCVYNSSNKLTSNNQFSRINSHISNVSFQVCKLVHTRGQLLLAECHL